MSGTTVIHEQDVPPGPELAFKCSPCRPAAEEIGENQRGKLQDHCANRGHRLSTPQASDSCVYQRRELNWSVARTSSRLMSALLV
jgi:hypothetical protein